MTSQVFLELIEYLESLPSEDETMGGGGGNDTMDGPEGDGTINERTVTDPEGDTLSGTAARDRYIGGEGADCLTGGLNQDTLYGGGDRDTLLGENSVDVLFGNTEGDSILGGDGDDSIFGGKGGDVIFGEAEDDEIFGNLGGDTMFGDAGDDCLYGGQDNDFLSGDAGDDLLSGDLGIDTLIGGEGEDSFVLSENTGGDSEFFADEILDYDPEEDQILLVGDLTQSDLEFESITVDEDTGVVIRTDDLDNPRFLAIVFGVVEDDLDIVVI
jgi:Ca2+-binding RTX toxin-like protein